jgi:hypothetical protein
MTLQLFVEPGLFVGLRSIEKGAAIANLYILGLRLLLAAWQTPLLLLLHAVVVGEYEGGGIQLTLRPARHHQLLRVGQLWLRPPHSTRHCPCSRYIQLIIYLLFINLFIFIFIYLYIYVCIYVYIYLFI